MNNLDVFHCSQQLSQFWYDEDTIEVLAQEAIHTVGPDGKIALISCPSLFPKIKALAPAGVEGISVIFNFKVRAHAL